MHRILGFCSLLLLFISISCIWGKMKAPRTFSDCLVVAIFIRGPFVCMEFYKRKGKRVAIKYC